MLLDMLSIVMNISSIMPGLNENKSCARIDKREFVSTYLSQMSTRAA